ncbi:ArdC family protein [Botrimarina mediterranea]|uniref:N-terminal domain-containing protein n=1 Tax=Botrimarina mediterranea TaxID=2528022 RepID=A0A518K9S7_9BACT|nr:ArdC family protein [Botrimarina mediterranea]QDV74539.1 hypothetical protein Spa11_27430 [Botrimarina mediterranea]QDV79179.1 hypothetical protein K2D_27900 [Planctomycetes bacterium K2D]
MKRDEATKLSDELLADLASQLDGGKSEQLVKYLDAMSQFHNYSFGNCLLIARQRPNATLVAGFHAWKKRGRIVKKGEKGICILAPMVRKADDDVEGEKKVFGFRAAHVFDIEQTEGDELPDVNRVGGDPGDALDRLRAASSSLGIVVTEEEDLGGADGVSKGGAVVLRSGLSPAEAFATLAHELAHELLHRGEDRKTLSKSVKELEAEAVAYVVARAAGLENALLQASDYIQCHRGDSEMLAKSLTRIQQTASRLIEAIRETETVAS